MLRLLLVLSLAACGQNHQPQNHQPQNPEGEGEGEAVCGQVLRCTEVDDIGPVAVWLDGECITCAETTAGPAWIRVARASCGR